MKASKFYLFFSIIFCTTIFLSDTAFSQGPKEGIKNAMIVINELKSVPDYSIPNDLLSRCHALAIFPSVYKAGFIIGGSFGKGIFVLRDSKTKNWHAPIFLTIGGGSLGWQIGVEAIDLVLVIMNERGVNAFMHDNLKLGGDVSVTAGPVGRSFEAGTDVTIKSEIYSYSRSKGLFAGLAIQGSYIHQDIGTNEAFYGKPYTLTEILSGNVPVPLEGKQLLDQLNRLMPWRKAPQ